MKEERDRADIDMAGCDVLLCRLCRLRGAMRIWFCIDGLALLGCVVAAMVLVDFVIDRMFEMDIAQRVIMLVLMCGVCVWIICARLIGRMFARVTDDVLCGVIERHYHELGGSLLSAIQFARVGDVEGMGISEEMLCASIGRGIETSRGIDFCSVIDSRRRGMNVLCGLVAVVLIVVGGVMVPGTGIWFERNVLLGNVAWPRETELVVLGSVDGEIVVACGDSYVVEVGYEGVRPMDVTLDYEMVGVSGVGGDWSGSEAVVGVGERFRYVFGGVLDDIRVRARGGDGMSEWVRICAVDRPIVVELKLVAHEPGYVGGGVKELLVDREVYEVLRGSELEILGRANKGLSKAELVCDGEMVIEMEIGSDDGSGSDEFGTVIKIGDGSGIGSEYGIRLIDGEVRGGLESERCEKFRVRVVDDGEPVVVARVIGVSEMITRVAVLGVRCWIEDDYGIVGGGLVFGWPGGRRMEFVNLDEAMSEDGCVVEGYEYELGVGGLGLEEGERLRFRVEARDNDGVMGSKAGVSSEFSFRIVSEKELREDLMSRRYEQKLELERLLHEQRGLVDSMRVFRVEMRRDGVSSDEYKRVNGIERSQRLIGVRCVGVARQLGELIDEARNNGIGGEGGGDGRDEYGGEVLRRVIDGLNELSDDVVLGVVEMLGAVADLEGKKGGDDEAMGEAIRGQEEVERILGRVLQEMVRGEGMEKAVDQLRALIEAERAVLRDTKRKAETAREKLFDE